jgi:hypothetical protein
MRRKRPKTDGKTTSDTNDQLCGAVFIVQGEKIQKSSAPQNAVTNLLASIVYSTVNSRSTHIIEDVH